MIMQNALSRRFGTIRWKLAGSYVLVALLVALVGEMLLVAALIFLFNSRLITDAFQARASTYAAALRADFEPTISASAVGARITDLIQRDTQQLNTRQPSLQINLGGEDIPVQTFVIDARGTLLAAIPRGSYQPGTLLSTLEPREMYSYTARALQGMTDTVQLSGWVGANRQLVSAAPVQGERGMVLGAVVMRSDPLPIAELIGGVSLSLLMVLVPVIGVGGLLGLLYGWFAGRGFSRRLVRLTSANAALAAGDLAQRVRDTSPDEIGQLGRQFDAMADQLTETLRALRQLADQNAQLAERAGHLAMIEERNRLARDLHDSVSQELFSLSMLAAAARRTLDRQPTLAAQQLDEIQTMAQRALQETRSLIFALRPAALGDRGLAPALRDLAVAAHDRQGLAIDLHIEGERRLPLEHEQALFRIAQEALANVARHSGVRAARIALEYSDEDVTLMVADAGRGFDTHAAPTDGSLGLHSMRERAAALGGRLELHSAPGQGTTLNVSLPVMDEIKRQAGLAAAR